MAQQTKDSDRARQADQEKHHARHPHNENFLAQGGSIAVDVRAEIARLKKRAGVGRLTIGMAARWSRATGSTWR